MNTQDKIRKILALLGKAYGKPRAFKKTDPVDEIIRTVLSQNTNDRNSLAAFAVLKKNFRSWDALLRRTPAEIARLIKHAGLANIKAVRIKEVLSEIKRREGKISLAALKCMDTAAALEYLRSLKGVGPKTAACVLLFSFGKPVMPVDTHIFRVTKRLGLIGANVNIEEAHKILTEAIMALVPRRGLLRKPCSGSRPECLSRALIYKGHLGIIEHGRRTCKAGRPLCGVCVVYGLCGFRQKRIYRNLK